MPKQKMIETVEGAMVEEDGSYTAILMVRNCRDEQQARTIAGGMHEILTDHLAGIGIKPVAELNDLINPNEKPN